ncbi:hypothetical protein [Catellatospora vulcania]|uniref:hypothetical protein n=1 Tax=Catellatospora vulcania TaxID=1460450 RepID=UPI0012D48B5C|nr:hypothetical protein [Catellatospora vulcania]
MRHPAQTGRFFYIAVTFTLFGLACVGAVTSGPSETYRPLALMVGWVLLAIGLINFAVHAAAVLMRDHEMWRATHFTEVTEIDE